MSKLLSFILLLFISYNINAQEITDTISTEYQEELIRLSVRKADSLRNVEPIDQLLNSGNIINNDLVVKLTLIRASRCACYNDLYSYDRVEDTSFFYKNVKEVLKTYETANQQSYCTLKTKVQFKKYYFLNHLVWVYRKNLNDSITEVYKKTQQKLKSKGLKPERDGFGLGGIFIKGKDIWLGLEFSFYSSYKGVTKVYENCDNVTHIFFPDGKHIVSVNALTFGYSRSIESENNELSLSLIELNSPFLLIPAKFGFQFNQLFNHHRYFYRPTIGISMGPVSVSYAYNVVFAKKDRQSVDRHLLFIKIAYPITNHRYNLKK